MAGALMSPSIARAPCRASVQGVRASRTRPASWMHVRSVNRTGTTAHAQKSYKNAAIAAFLLTVGVSFGCQNAVSNAEISAKFMTPLTPPTWTFAIWGVIFSSQAAMLALARSGMGLKLDDVAPWLMAGWLSEAIWQALFSTQHPLALALCAPVLVFGAWSFIKALLACKSVPQSEHKVSRFLLVTSTAINAAWLTVAASLAILVAVTANSQASLQYLAAALSVGVAAIGAKLTMQQGAPAYGATLLYSFWGVHKQNISNVVVGSELMSNLALGICVLFGALSVAVIIKALSNDSGTIETNEGGGEPLLQN